jgi:glycosyltransferase involved in cell wall biosynthesis
MSKKIVIAANSAWNLFNFRGGLIRSLIAAGYEVVAVAPPDEYTERLSAFGCRVIPLLMDNQGTHPVRDLLLFWRFFILLRAERPDAYLGYTVKPNVYGSLAANLLHIPVINNISGLGAVFIKGGWLTQFVGALYRVALSNSPVVFFQNNDDRQLFIERGLVSARVTDLLPGSGIDLGAFSPLPLPNRPPIRFLLIARMLWDKGIGEFVEAAGLLKQKGIDAECCLIGFLDVQNPAAISKEQINDWIASGTVSYQGVTDNVREAIAQADCVVLPSYREGVPRVLLEAAAMARPIITTSAVGCREVVDDGINGYLCRPRDADALAACMIRVSSLTRVERMIMGARGRAKVERDFNEQKVIKKYHEAISFVLNQESQYERLVKY